MECRAEDEAIRASRSRGLGSLERMECSMSCSSASRERSSGLREMIIWVGGWMVSDGFRLGGGRGEAYGGI